MGFTPFRSTRDRVMPPLRGLLLHRRVHYTAGMTKDSGLRIRVERELRDQFLEACRQQDRPAAQVLREFMRQHVAENQLPKVKSSQKQGRSRRDESALF